MALRLCLIGRGQMSSNCSALASASAWGAPASDRNISRADMQGPESTGDGVANMSGLPGTSASDSMEWRARPTAQSTTCCTWRRGCALSSMQRDTGALGYPRNHSVVAFSHSCHSEFRTKRSWDGREGMPILRTSEIELNHSYYDEPRSLQVT
jgi:hypothetical protein